MTNRRREIYYLSTAKGEYEMPRKKPTSSEGDESSDGGGGGENLDFQAFANQVQSDILDNPDCRKFLEEKYQERAAAQGVGAFDWKTALSIFLEALRQWLNQNLVEEGK